MTATFRLTCPYCGEPTRVPLESFYRWWPEEDAVSALDKKAQELKNVKAAAASYCPECEGLISLMIEGRQSLLRDMLSGQIDSDAYAYHESDLKLDSYFPRPYGADLSESIPLTIRNIFPDMVEDVARNRNSAAILTNCRGIMEVALRALESKSGSPPLKASLVNRIDHLVSKGLITADLAEWAHQIRLDGNKSAHELIGDPALARAYVDFLKLFLEVTFDLPERIRIMKSDRAEQPAPSGAKGQPAST